MSVQDTAPQTAEKRALAEQVYNMFMAEIEPELILENIPLLAETYKHETAEQHAARMSRYTAAYKKYEEEIKVFYSDVNEQVRDGKRNALKVKEDQEKIAEQNTLNSLASAFA